MLVPASRFDDYTVGLICALPLEMAAVRTMLDECHGRPAHRHLADTNSYYLGRIGEHNVVAAGLPSGSPGSVSAATVAAHMQYTFKSIRFGLVVGVGSGVPCASDDIRLGDVVVSTPGDGSGGVVQYDPVAAASEGRFVRTGALNKPPQVLLTAVADLAADHLMDGNRISSILARTAEGKPSLRARIARPPDELDHLFQAHAAHVSDAATCAGCDSALLVDRPTREDEGPVVHYGVIASGNQVLNDGRTRDKLRAQCKVLCFEMEAAGLMDNFPCLVIRGVGDYADAHKSNRWREYAAFTAAAYAKELLSIVSASQVSQTPTILEALTGGKLLKPRSTRRISKLIIVISRQRRRGCQVSCRRYAEVTRDGGERLVNRSKPRSDAGLTDFQIVATRTFSSGSPQPTTTRYIKTSTHSTRVRPGNGCSIPTNFSRGRQRQSRRCSVPAFLARGRPSWRLSLSTIGAHAATVRKLASPSSTVTTRDATNKPLEMCLQFSLSSSAHNVSVFLNMLWRSTIATCADVPAPASPS